MFFSNFDSYHLSPLLNTTKLVTECHLSRIVKVIEFNSRFKQEGAKLLKKKIK